MGSKADVIRNAATLMRGWAKSAPPGPWACLDRGDRIVRLLPGGEFEHVVDEPLSNWGTAEHIASWHPGVALVVAEFLNDCARQLESGSCDEPGAVETAYAIARTYLGGEVTAP